MPTKNRRATRKDTTSFNRGGRRVTLVKSPNLIEVRFKDNAIVENLPGRLADRLDLPCSLHFVRQYPGQPSAVYCCRTGQRDMVMHRLRTASDEVLYCSHVLQRTAEMAVPDGDIGLDNKFFVEFHQKPTTQQIEQTERQTGSRVIWEFPENPRGAIFELTQAATQNPIRVTRMLTSSRAKALVRLRKAIKTAEPCPVEAKMAKAIPNDPVFPQQWHLLNTGQGGGRVGAD